MEKRGVPPASQAPLRRVLNREVRQFYGVLRRRHAQPWEILVEGDTEQRTFRLGDRFVKVVVTLDGPRKYRSFDIVEPSLEGQSLREAAAVVDAYLHSN